MQLMMMCVLGYPFSHDGVTRSMTPTAVSLTIVLHKDIFLGAYHSQWHGDTFRHDYCSDVTQTSRHGQIMTLLKYASCFYET